MTNKKKWLGILVMVLVFGMTIVGCDTDTDDGNEPIPTPPMGTDPGIGNGGGGKTTDPLTMQKLAATLANLPKNTAANPHTVRLESSVTIDTQDPSSDGVWATINNAVKKAEKFVFLDLSECSAMNNWIIGDLTPSGCRMNIINSNEYIKGIVLPSTLTSIEYCAFYDCASLTKITIPNSVTRIERYAFSGCTSLTNVIIPNSVTRIDDYVFSGCASLASITIPNNVTSIGYRAFAQCTSLTGITIPKSVISIGGRVSTIGGFHDICIGTFEGCTSLTAINVAADNTEYSSDQGVVYTQNKTILIAYPAGKTGVVTIPNSVIRIETGAFDGCIGFKSVTIPDSITSIGDSAFYKCTDLTSVTLPCNLSGSFKNRFGDQVTSVTIYGSGAIPKDAFQDCIGLTSVTILDSVTSIGYRAFAACTSLASVSISNSVTSIGEQAFSNCTGLTSVTLSCNLSGNFKHNFYKVPVTNVTVSGSGAIPSNAFDDCTDLERVIIGAGITSVSEDEFDNCSALKSIQVDDGNKAYSSMGGVLFNKAKTTLILFPEGITGSYSIPGSVTSIGDYAFEHCKGLTSVTIPFGVTSIGNGAFYNCTSLTGMTIPVSVTSIGYRTKDATNSFMRGAFENCTALTSLTIPVELTVLFNEIFRGYSDLTLKLTGTGSVPDRAFETWLNSDYYSDRITSVTIGDGVTGIGKEAFSGCRGITSITIGAGVNSFWTSSFSGCTSLERIAVDSANWAFSSVNGILYNKGQTSLLLVPQKISGSITIPSGIETIGERAFEGRTGITSVTIPNSLTQPILEGITMDTKFIDGISTIRSYAFSGCTNLTSVTFGGSAIFDHSIYVTRQLTAEILFFLIGLEAAPLEVFFLDTIKNAFFHSYDLGFYDNAFPQGSSGTGGNALKTAYLAGGAGTYTRTPGGSNWTKR